MSSTNPAPYPGNPSLPREVREKILSTFRHALNLFGQSKLDDCVIGCDFILKMDPRFSPARRLMDKARNPRAEVDVAELEALVASTPTRQERVVAADPDRLLVRAVESFNARDFDAAIGAAQQVLSVLPGNQDARQILEQANAKKAAQPVLDASRLRAIAALDGNRVQDARAELARMRELDPDHPAVALLERRIGSAATAASAAGAAPEPLDALSLDVPAADAFGSDGGAPAEGSSAYDPGATVAINLGELPPSPAPAPSPASSSEDNLQGLSLDSLSLDLPPATGPVTPPAPDPFSSHTGPLEQPLAAEKPPRGSPSDLWSEEAAAPEIDFSSLSVPPPPSLSVPPALEPTPEPVPPPEIEGPRGGERDIASLLRQGDEAVRRGDRQQAIEIWSRIFLIDINNSDAVARIEKARQEMAEGNRVISEGLKNGREKFEAGDFSGAREAFLQVLAIDENEPTARFHLDRIEEQLSRAAGSSASPAAAVSAASSSSASALAPAPQAAPARRPATEKAIRINPRVVALVGIFAVLTLGGVYFVFKWARPKPVAVKTAARERPASVQHASELIAAGKVADAEAELKRIPRSSPDYAKARKTLAGLSRPSAAAAPGSGPGGQPPGSSIPPVAASASAQQLRATAEKALSEKRYIEALKNFHLAAAAFRDDPTFAQEMGVASDKVSALTPAVKLYNEGEYETAIPVLWRISQEDRDNQDARSYLLRAYYNQGVTQLQNGLYQKAMQSFTEALSVDPSDAEASRHRKFAERYQKGDLDLMGRIYVRHLNHRP